MDYRSLRQLQGLDVRRAFTFPFDDPDWPRKIWLGGLLAAVPIVGWLLLSAYTLRALRWVALDQTATLPQWRRGDLKRMMVEGLRFYAVTILVLVTIVCPIALLVAIWTTLGGDLPDLDRLRSVPPACRGRTSEPRLGSLASCSGRSSRSRRRAWP